MRPSRSVFRVRQKVVPLPVRVSLLGGIFVTTEKPTSKQSPHDAFTTGWPVACYVDPIFIPCGAPEAHEACLIWFTAFYSDVRTLLGFYCCCAALGWRRGN